MGKFRRQVGGADEVTAVLVCVLSTASTSGTGLVPLYSTSLDSRVKTNIYWGLYYQMICLKSVNTTLLC